MFNSNKFIIKPYNKVFFVVVTLIVIITALLCRYIKELDELTSRSFVLNFMIFTLIFLTVYRISNFFDKEFAAIAYPEKAGINFYNELPFYPCNLITLFFPVSFFFNIRHLFSFCFLYSFIFGLLALTFPSKGYEKYSIFKFRVFGYYVSHLLMMMTMPIVLASGLYMPATKDIFPAFLIFFVLSFLAFLLNIYLIKTKKNTSANYFFNTIPDGNPLLEMLYKYIPYPFLFLLPGLIVSMGYSYTLIRLLEMFI